VYLIAQGHQEDLEVIHTTYKHPTNAYLQERRMRTKEEDAKWEQAYNPEPTRGVCAECRHCIVGTNIVWDEKEAMKVKKQGPHRCGLGCFRVKKTATCRMFERED
jgi:hypothetical protein